jgi:hypothetical protein
MIKAFFCWLYLLIGMDTSTPHDVVYSNPMEGYTLQVNYGYHMNYSNENIGLFNEEKDSREDSGDSDDEFNSTELLRLNTDKSERTYIIEQSGYPFYLGRLSTAYLPPILSPPDVNASLT